MSIAINTIVIGDQVALIIPKLHMIKINNSGSPQLYILICP